MLPRVITCGVVLLLQCVVELYAAVLYVVMCSCMLCNVVTCYQELLHAVQCCYMLH